MAGTAPLIPGCRDLSLIGERVARSLFSAVSERIDRAVTVTVYPPLSEGRTWAGFDRAAAVAQQLGVHPSVITIHDWGHTDDGRPWIVTDPQPAEAVDTMLKLDGPLAVERALQVGVLLAGALETAHRAGIIHGDLSPARLVFGGHGEPLLAETGLAAFAVFPGLSALNNPVRYHAPPEVLERGEVTPATDVFSLATTVYALLAGRAPQEKPAEITDSNASLLLRILQMQVPPIERPGLPPGLMDALRSPLAADPHKRPQQAIELAWLLQDVQRRAGLAVTEPVVLDLHDLRGSPGGGQPGTAPRRTPGPARPGAPIGFSWNAPATGAPETTAAATGLPSPARGRGPGAGAGAGAGATIFPFAEDAGRAAAGAGSWTSSPTGNGAPPGFPGYAGGPTTDDAPWPPAPATGDGRAAVGTPWPPDTDAPATDDALWAPAP
ncbi:MAG TPA: protein kinase, partial [Acidimicrobiales bacterium]|nr:protein kinase [Acidimicrobiales bacterium]